MITYSLNNSEKIKAGSEEQEKLVGELSEKQDAESLRLKRFLSMPDLSRTEGSPIRSLVERVFQIETIKHFDQIEVPEIVRGDISFDLFNFPPDHPARGKSDTYFIGEDHILRTHTTIMWYYYLNSQIVKAKIEKKLPLGVVSYGKVYRKDEIDRHHMNIFHQMDGLYLSGSQIQKITPDDLKDILAEIARAVYGQGVKYRFNTDTFPYTDPSIEMEIEKSGQWVEVLGGGIVRPVVLKNLGVNPDEYGGWAFGFGLERLAIVSMDLPDIRLLWSTDERVKKQLQLGNKYVPVSKYPPIVRDISFVVDKNFVPNNYFDLIRDIGGDLVEEVKLLDKYENPEKFGPDRVSYTYRIVYRSSDRTLELSEIEPLQAKIYRLTGSQFHAELR